MRLIDADKAIEEYTQIFVEKFGIEGGEMFKGVVKQMPTAYDVDKVLEQLENEKKFWNDATYNKEIGKQKARSYAYAIEIVKGGGIDAW